MEETLLRSEILKLLYDRNSSDPTDSVEEEAIVKQFQDQASSHQVHGVLNYLLQKNLIEQLSTSVHSRRFIFIKITAGGIDELQGRSGGAPNVTQIIHGDVISVSMGSNNRDVIIGKDIETLKEAPSDRHDEVAKE